MEAFQFNLTLLIFFCFHFYERNYSSRKTLKMKERESNTLRKLILQIIFRSLHSTKKLNTIREAKRKEMK